MTCFKKGCLIKLKGDSAEVWDVNVYYDWIVEEVIGDSYLLVDAFSGMEMVLGRKECEDNYIGCI